MLTKKTSYLKVLSVEVVSGSVRLSERSAHQGLPAANGETRVCLSIGPGFLRTSRCRPEVEADL